MPHSGVQILADRSGQVTVFCGATEIGQGSDDVLAAFVAEVLGIDAFDVRLVTGDTDLTPVDLGSYSSRVTVMMGNAAIQAAERAREMIVDAAAEELEVSPERLVFAQGRVFAAEDPSKALTFAEAVVFAETKFGTLGTVGSYMPPRAPGRFKGAGVGPSPAYSYTAVVVEVEVDETHRLDLGAEDLDRARHRPRGESGARARPGRGQRLHGSGRGADGRADLPTAACRRCPARWCTSFPRCSNTRA